MKVRIAELIMLIGTYADFVRYVVSCEKLVSATHFIIISNEGGNYRSGTRINHTVIKLLIVECHYRLIACTCIVKV